MLSYPVNLSPMWPPVAEREGQGQSYETAVLRVDSIGTCNGLTIQQVVLSIIYTHFINIITLFIIVCLL
jgi:hypothetical protein